MRRFFRSRGVISLAFVLLVAVGIGLGFGGFSYLLPGAPKIALVRAEDVFLFGQSARDIAEMLHMAEDRSIKGVVIVLDSPGGTAADSEDLAIQVLELRKKKPVVVSIGGIAASGGYLLSVVGDYVVAKPTSFVGNVGVILFAPSEFPPFEDIITTGPYKLTGGSAQTYLRMMEAAKEAFLKTVITQRGGKLKISKEEISTGRLWVGTEAVQNGLVDHVGSTTDAARIAAQLAGLRRFETVDLLEELQKSRPPSPFFFGGTEKPTLEAIRSHPVMKNYHRLMLLYIEPKDQ